MMKKTTMALAILVATLAFGAGSASAAEPTGTSTTTTYTAQQAVKAKVPLSATVTGLPWGVKDIGWHWCCPPHWKVYFGKASTRNAATAGGTILGSITAGCALVGGLAAAAACAARWGYIVSRAQIAWSQGKCLYIAWAPVNPWWVWAGSHGGSGCRW